MFKNDFKLFFLVFVLFFGLVSCAPDNQLRKPQVVPVVLKPLVEFYRQDKYRLNLLDVKDIEVSSILKIKWPGEANINHKIEFNTRCEHPEDPTIIFNKSGKVNQKIEGHAILSFLPWEIFKTDESSLCSLNLDIKTISGELHQVKLQEINITNINEAAELGLFSRDTKKRSIINELEFSNTAIESFPDGKAVITCFEGEQKIKRTKNDVFQLKDFDLNLESFDTKTCRVIILDDKNYDLKISPIFIIKKLSQAPILNFNPNTGFDPQINLKLGDIKIQNNNTFDIFVNLENLKNQLFKARLQVFYMVNIPPSFSTHVPIYRQANPFGVELDLDIMAEDLIVDKNIIKINKNSVGKINLLMKKSISCTQNEFKTLWGYGLDFFNKELVLEFKRKNQSGDWLDDNSLSVKTNLVAGDFLFDLTAWYPQKKPSNLNINLNWEFRGNSKVLREKTYLEDMKCG